MSTTRVKPQSFRMLRRTLLGGMRTANERTRRAPVRAATQRGLRRRKIPAPVRKRNATRSRESTPSALVFDISFVLPLAAEHAAILAHDEVDQRFAVPVVDVDQAGLALTGPSRRDLDVDEGGLGVVEELVGLVLIRVPSHAESILGQEDVG